MPKPSNFKGFLPFIVFFSGVLYYCYAYLLRIYPSVISQPLVEHLSLDAGQYGLLTSFYYFAYAPMQVPVGMMVDKIGVRKSLLFACLVATLGSFVFASADYFSMVASGRFFVGIGCAFAYVSALKIATVWLPKRYLATAAGCTTSGGMIAAILTNIYFAKALETHGFAFTEFIPVVIGVVLLIVIFMFVVEPNESNEGEMLPPLSFDEFKTYLKQIIFSKQLWLIGLVGAFLYIPSSVFLDTWATPYLMNVYKLSLQQATFASSVMLAGWITSSLITGMLSDYMGNRKVPLIFASLLSLIMACVLLYGPKMEYRILLIVMYIFGFGCGPHPLCHILAKENFSSVVAGTAISFANFLIMLGGFVFQPVLGYVLNFVEPNGVVGLAYSDHAYEIAMSLMPITLFISILLVLMIRDTYNR